MKQIITIIGSTLGAFILLTSSSFATDFIITNNTDYTFSQVKIADPTIRNTHDTVYPGDNVLQLKEDYNFVINLSSLSTEISIIVKNRLPTCYPDPRLCTFNEDSVVIQ